MSEVMDLSNLYVRTKLVPGAEVVLLRDVERYPHFIADRGSRGIVVDAEERNVAVRMRERIPGAEEWDNEVQWFDGCGREDQTALAAAEADLGLCSACPTFPYWPRVPMSDDVVWVTGMGQMGYAVMRGDRCIHDGLDSIGDAEALAAIERAPVAAPVFDGPSLPTVWLVIGETAIARDERGVILTTDEFDNSGCPLWESSVVCPPDLYRSLDTALNAAEEEARLRGLKVERLGAGWRS